MVQLTIMWRPDVWEMCPRYEEANRGQENQYDIFYDISQAHQYFV